MCLSTQTIQASRLPLVVSSLVSEVKFSFCEEGSANGVLSMQMANAVNVSVTFNFIC